MRNGQRPSLPRQLPGETDHGPIIGKLLPPLISDLARWMRRRTWGDRRQRWVSPHFSHLRVQMPRFRCGARRIGGHTAMPECTAASARFAALARSLRRSRRCSSSPWNHHVSSSRLALVAKPCAIFRNRCEKCGFRTIFLHAGARYRRSLSVPGLDLIRIN